MSTIDSNDEQEVKLIKIVRQTIERDEALRDKYEIKSKFRFVRDRLQALLNYLEKELEAKNIKEEEHESVIVESDEIIAYVYLFNAHGASIKTWHNMLMPKVFYEYSVNRPIYLDRKQIEALLKTKPNHNQHGYIAIAIKTADIQSAPQGVLPNQETETVRIKEGSLNFSKVISFTHNGIDYLVNKRGELIKKN